jgi:hypothetical protein
MERPGICLNGASSLLGSCEQAGNSILAEYLDQPCLGLKPDLVQRYLHPKVSGTAGVKWLGAYRYRARSIQCRVYVGKSNLFSWAGQ